ncbi:MAG: MOSC domain-containing protein [Acutalibacteraceae bacterium]|jgi:MOSC domain-containing protein YiiM
MAKVVAVNISEKKGTAKKAVEKGILIEDFGLQGDAHGGKGHRQVSLLAKESVEKSKAMAKDPERVKGICEGSFAENITTEGIELYTLAVGTKLRIADAVLKISQIGKECHDGCEIKRLMGKCIMPQEGIFAKVVTGGTIKAGDEIIIEPDSGE